MKRITICLLMLLGMPLASVQAQEGQARSLSELLKMVEQGRAADQSEARQREQAFAQAKADQQRLLREARGRFGAEEKRSQQLEDAFEQNETRIADLTDALDKRLGSLKELFGVLQQVTGDTRSVFENSIVSAQYPGREAFMDMLGAKMGSSTELASIEELERLWFELQREMTETGKVARFEASVIGADGEESTTQVTRIGGFNIVKDGSYLSYNPETAKIAELLRQPEGRYTDSASAVAESQPGDGLVKFGIDPTRGQILALLLERPSLAERIQQGGIVGYVIIAIGILALLIALERFVVLNIAGTKVNAQLKSSQANANNPLGRVLKVYEDNRAVDVETLELKLGEAILKETPKLNRGLLFLKIIAVVAPLMGLLGTVTGMIKTFQAITLFGTGDPKLMAGGISQALVTTVLGLCVAIPVVLLHTLVSGRSNRIVHILQEQSAGIIAERSEAAGRSNA